MIVLAQARLSEKSNEFFRSMQWEVTEGRGTTSEIIEQMALVAVGLMVLFGLLYLCGVFQARRSEPVARQPYRLFRQTMREAALPFLDRLLLRFVARASGLPHPTLILMSPGLLEQFGRAWAERVVVPPLRNAAWRRLSEIARKLYGQALPAL